MNVSNVLVLVKAILQAGDALELANERLGAALEEAGVPKILKSVSTQVMPVFYMALSVPLTDGKPAREHAQYSKAQSRGNRFCRWYCASDKAALEFEFDDVPADVAKAMRLCKAWADAQAAQYEAVSLAKAAVWKILKA